MSGDIQSNLLNGKTWLRLLFMALFGLVYAVADVVLLVIVVIQFGFVLFTADRNRELQEFGAQVSQYLYQVLRFLTYNSDQKPFPFAEWPEGEAAEAIDTKPPEPKADSGNASTRKTTAKKASKKVAKKKAAKKTAKKASKKKSAKKKASKTTKKTPSGDS